MDNLAKAHWGFVLQFISILTTTSSINLHYLINGGVMIEHHLNSLLSQLGHPILRLLSYVHVV